MVSMVPIKRIIFFSIVAVLKRTVHLIETIGLENI